MIPLKSSRRTVRRIEMRQTLINPFLQRCSVNLLLNKYMSSKWQNLKIKLSLSRYNSTATWLDPAKHHMNPCSFPTYTFFQHFPCTMNCNHMQFERVWFVLLVDIGAIRKTENVNRKYTNTQICLFGIQNLCIYVGLNENTSEQCNWFVSDTHFSTYTIVEKHTSYTNLKQFFTNESLCLYFCPISV